MFSLLGTFNKVLFPTLRMGYIVAPDQWLDPLLRLRRLLELYPAVLPQRTLAIFQRVAVLLLSSHVACAEPVHAIRRAGRQWTEPERMVCSGAFIPLLAQASTQPKIA
jgi:hypothetical protein